MNTNYFRQTKIAVITGAGSGIGAAVAHELSLNGWQLVLLGRRVERLESTRLALAHPDNAISIAADITSIDDVERAFTEAVARFGRIDVLFNNAGSSGPTARIDEIPVAEFEETLRVNVTGTFLCSQAAFKVMAGQTPQGGRIINNGSIAARKPRPHAAAYAISKHAVTGISRSIALDGRAVGITCTQVDIGNVATELLAGFGAGTGALQPDGSRLVEPTFSAENVAKLVASVAGLDASTAVPEILVTAAGMPFDGRG